MQRLTALQQQHAVPESIISGNDSSPTFLHNKENTPPEASTAYK
jgi:hypothetical protein